MLNDSVYSKLFQDINIIPRDEVLLVYRIFLQVARRNDSEVEKMIKKNRRAEIWRYLNDLFIVKNQGKIGTCINDEMKSIDSSYENLIEVDRIIGENYCKLLPSLYTKLCGTSGLFVFILRDILEWCGILIDKKCVNPSKTYGFSKYAFDYYSNKSNIVESRLPK